VNSLKMPPWMRWFWIFEFIFAPWTLAHGANAFSTYFDCELKAESAQCTGLLGTWAEIRVQKSTLPKKSSLELVALNQQEGLLEKSGLKMLSKSRTTIDQSHVIIQTFTYDNLSNVMRPVFVLFIDVLKSEQLAVIEVACASRDCSEYEPALIHLQENLKMAPRFLETLLK
jgi:hypothetical protein